MSVDTSTVEATVFKSLEDFGAEPDQITREATLEDLDIDSLDLAELAQIVEEEHGASIKGADIEKIKTVGDAIDLVAERATK